MRITLYQFIASEYELPALHSSKLHAAEGKEKSQFVSSDDLGDLEIVQEMIGYLFVDITAYTKLKHIYRLNLEYTPERGQRLLDYLKQNCVAGKRCELWTIDLGAELWEEIHEALVHLQRSSVSLDGLTAEILAKACNHKDLGGQDFPRLLMIQ